jgi:hypothetical protein
MQSPMFTEQTRTRIFYVFAGVAVGMVLAGIARIELSMRPDMWRWLALYFIGVVQNNPLVALLLIGVAVLGLGLLAVAHKEAA